MDRIEDTDKETKDLANVRSRWKTRVRKLPQQDVRSIIDEHCPDLFPTQKNAFTRFDSVEKVLWAMSRSTQRPFEESLKALDSIKGIYDGIQSRIKQLSSPMSSIVQPHDRRESASVISQSNGGETSAASQNQPQLSPQAFMDARIPRKSPNRNASESSQGLMSSVPPPPQQSERRSSFGRGSSALKPSWMSQEQFNQRTQGGGSISSQASHSGSTVSAQPEKRNSPSWGKPIGASQTVGKTSSKGWGKPIRQAPSGTTTDQQESIVEANSSSQVSASVSSSKEPKYAASQANNSRNSSRTTLQDQSSPQAFMDARIPRKSPNRNASESSQGLMSSVPPPPQQSEHRSSFGRGSSALKPSWMSQEQFNQRTQGGGSISSQTSHGGSTVSAQPEKRNSPSWGKPIGASQSVGKTSSKGWGKPIRQAPSGTTTDQQESIVEANSSSQVSTSVSSNKHSHSSSDVQPGQLTRVSAVFESQPRKSSDSSLAIMNEEVPQKKIDKSSSSSEASTVSTQISSKKNSTTNLNWEPPAKRQKQNPIDTPHRSEETVSEDPNADKGNAPTKTNNPNPTGPRKSAPSTSRSTQFMNEEPCESVPGVSVHKVVNSAEKTSPVSLQTSSRRSTIKENKLYPSEQDLMDAAVETVNTYGPDAKLTDALPFMFEKLGVDNHNTSPLRKKAKEILVQVVMKGMSQGGPTSINPSQISPPHGNVSTNSENEDAGNVPALDNTHKTVHIRQLEDVKNVLPKQEMTKTDKDLPDSKQDECSKYYMREALGRFQYFPSKHRIEMLMRPDISFDGKRALSGLLQPRTVGTRVSFLHEKLGSDQIQNLLNRLRRWEPNLSIVSLIDVNCTRQLIECSEQDIKQAGCVDVKNLINIEGSQMPSAHSQIPSDVWGKKRDSNDNGSALVLFMLPVNPQVNRKKRADCHLFPKGTFLQVNGSSTALAQRKQESHDASSWKGICRPLDLTELVVSPNKRLVVEFTSFDDEPYAYCLAFCKFQSGGALYSDIMNQRNKMKYLSRDESIQRCRSVVPPTIIEIDCDEHTDATANIIGKVVFSLIDPVSRKIVETPVRGQTCKHFQCFDLRTFLVANERPAGTRWRCPCCENFLSVYDLEYCGLTEDLLSEFKNEVNSSQHCVELQVDGKYRLLPPRKRKVRNEANGHSSIS